MLEQKLSLRFLVGRGEDDEEAYEGPHDRPARHHRAPTLESAREREHRGDHRAADENRGENHHKRREQRVGADADIDRGAFETRVRASNLAESPRPRWRLS